MQKIENEKDFILKIEDYGIRDIKLGNVDDNQFLNYLRDNPAEVERLLLTRDDVIGTDTSIQQRVHTPLWLCNDVVDKLVQLSSFNYDSSYSILAYNFEFIVSLISKGIRSVNLTLVTDNTFKINLAKKLYNINTIYVDDFLKWETKMKFDVILMNPPYHAPTKKQDSIWKDFVIKSLLLLKNDGFIASINPPSWRKPQHKLFEIFRANDVKYLEIHNQNDGKKTFGTGTRYDWYIMKKCKGYKTTIIDEKGKSIVQNLNDIPCLPHYNIKEFISLLGEKNNLCKIIYSRSAYGHDKPHMSKEQNKKHIHPCINATRSAEFSMMYSSTSKHGHFGVPKVIMGIVSPENGFFDERGEYGLTDNCFAIAVSSSQEGIAIEKAIKTTKFLEFLETCKWSGMAFDPTIFIFLKSKWWKEFINE